MFSAGEEFDFGDALTNVSELHFVGSSSGGAAKSTGGARCSTETKGNILAYPIGSAKDVVNL